MSRLLAASLLFVFSSLVHAEVFESFRLQNAPLSDFVEWFSEVSGKTVVTSQELNQVQITVQAIELDKEDLIPFVEGVLQANGLKLVESGPVYQILTQPIGIDPNQAQIEPPEQLTRVFKFDHLRATDALQSVTSILNSSISNVQQGPVRPASTRLLPSTNALVVSATQEQIDALAEFVADIDQPARQLLIEAVIVESDLGTTNEIGVNLVTALAETGFSAASGVLPTALNLKASGPGATVIFSKEGDIRALADALSIQDDTKILSTPKILVQDRQRGYISVGQNVPFLVSRETTNGGNLIQQVQRQDVGVSLQVTPHIIGDKVTLTIQQESSSVSSSTQASDIITNRRTIQTVASVKNGESLLLGGLVTEEQRENVTKVPVLGSIPLLGRLFKKTSKEDVQRELNVLLKVEIL